MKYKITESQRKRLFEQFKDEEIDDLDNEDDSNDYIEDDPQPEYNEDEPWNSYDEKDRKRYAVTMDFYLWGKNDEDVIKRAQMIEHDIDQKYDNRIKIINIHEIPFASAHSREVKIR